MMDRVMLCREKREMLCRGMLCKGCYIQICCIIGGCKQRCYLDGCLVERCWGMLYREDVMHMDVRKGGDNKVVVMDSDVGDVV